MLGLNTLIVCVAKLVPVILHCLSSVWETGNTDKQLDLWQQVLVLNRIDDDNIDTTMTMPIYLDSRHKTNKPAAQAAGADPPSMKLHQ